MVTKILQSWSGGFDSTYLLDWNLKQGYNVTATYIEIINNEQKTKRERKAIEQMLPYFKKFKNFEYVEGSKFEAASGGGFGLSQPLIWLTALAYAYYVTYFDEVQLGYILNDCAISYIDELKNIWKSFNGLTDKQLPKLGFPLIKYDKAHNINNLPLELVEKCTWCERHDDSGIPCLECASCQKLIIIPINLDLLEKVEILKPIKIAKDALKTIISDHNKPIVPPQFEFGFMTENNGKLTVDNHLIKY